jgi:hypothetical protein
MYLSVQIFICGLNTIPTMTYDSGCLKIIKDTRQVTDVKFQFPGLDAHLT